MYKALGITGETNRLVTAIYNFVGPIASKYRVRVSFVWADTKRNVDLIFIFFLIDRVGRKGPLIFGTITITVLLIIEAVLGSRDLESNPAMSRAGVAMIFLVSIVFSWSFGPVSWTYMSEVMVSFNHLESYLLDPKRSLMLEKSQPMQIRARGNAFATGIGNWLINVIFSQASPQGLGNLGWKYYFVFVAFSKFLLGLFPRLALANIEPSQTLSLLCPASFCSSQRQKACHWRRSTCCLGRGHLGSSQLISAPKLAMWLNWSALRRLRLSCFCSLLPWGDLPPMSIMPLWVL